MKLTDEQLRILRHMLGIDVNDTPRPREHRDYYCANPGDERLLELQQFGMVEKYRVAAGYEWFTTTDAGKAAARASQQAMLLPKRKRIYLRWLSVKDTCPDLTFRDYLVSPEFADSRKAA